MRALTIAVVGAAVLATAALGAASLSTAPKETVVVPDKPVSLHGPENGNRDRNQQADHDPVSGLGRAPDPAIR